MRKNKKMNSHGFTLLELLAVIVVLAIIALIVTPVVSDIISTAKLKSNKESALNYIEAADNYFADNLITIGQKKAGENIINDLAISGGYASSGSITVDKEGNVAMYLKIGDKCYSKRYDQAKEEMEVKDCFFPTLKAIKSDSPDTLFLGSPDVKSGLVRKLSASYTSPDSYASSWQVNDPNGANIMAYAVGSSSTFYDIVFVPDSYNKDVPPQIFAPVDSSFLFGYLGNSLYGDLYDLNLDWLNTSNVENMSSMFYAVGFNKMQKINLGEYFNTSKVKTMNGMFSAMGYYALESVNLGSHFDTSNVTSMTSMFYNMGVDSLKKLNLGSEFDTSKVKDTDAENMKYMFNHTGTNNLTELDLGPQFTNFTAYFLDDTGIENGTTIKVPSSIFVDEHNIKSVDKKETVNYTKGTFVSSY